MNIDSQINKNYVRDLQQTLYDICDEVDTKLGDIAHDNIEHGLFLIFDEHKQTVRRKLWTHFAPKPI